MRKCWGNVSSKGICGGISESGGMWKSWRYVDLLGSTRKSVGVDTNARGLRNYITL